MCLRRAPEKYIAGAALDRAGLHSTYVCSSIAVCVLALISVTDRTKRIKAFAEVCIVHLRLSRHLHALQVAV
jgi:hypothetical protein